MVNDDRIQELKDKIFEYETLWSIGVELYKDSKDRDLWNKAMWFGIEADKMKRRLKENFGAIYEEA